MKLSNALMAVAVALLILALRGVFGDFPAEWEWVGVVLAAVGIVMASPAILQITFGRPNLTVQIKTDAQGENRLLIVFLANPPVNDWIKRLGVKRDTIESLTAQIQIAEVGSGTILVPIRQARIYSDSDETDVGRARVALPPTYSVAASIAVATWDTANSRAVVPPDRLRQEQVLPPGYFEARIVLIVDGEPKKLAGRFLVGQTADDLVWSEESLKPVT